MCTGEIANAAIGYPRPERERLATSWLGATNHTQRYGVPHNNSNPYTLKLYTVPNII